MSMTGRNFGPQPRAQDLGGSFSLSADATPILSIQNTSGRDLLIIERSINIVTGSAGVTVDMGIAADGVSNGDNLIDGQSVATNNLPVFANGTNGGSTRRWAAGEFVNLRKVGGTITALSGRVVLMCVPYN